MYHCTKSRLEEPADSEGLFARRLRDSKGHEPNLLLAERLAECNAMVNAGTETTTAALTTTIFLLYKHPAVLSRVRGEIDEACPGDETLAYDKASRLSYR